MYKITIEQTETNKKISGKEWKCLSEKDGKREMGYTPEIEKLVDEEIIIYTQIVEHLDLAVVIQAINNML